MFILGLILLFIALTYFYMDIEKLKVATRVTHSRLPYRSRRGFSFLLYFSFLVLLGLYVSCDLFFVIMCFMYNICVNFEI